MGAETYVGLLTHQSDEHCVQLYLVRDPYSPAGGDRWTYTVRASSPGVVASDVAPPLRLARELREWANDDPHMLRESLPGSLDDVMAWAAACLFRTSIPPALYRPLFRAHGNYDHVFRQEGGEFGLAFRDPSATRDVVDAFLASLPVAR